MVTSSDHKLSNSNGLPAAPGMTAPDGATGTPALAVGMLVARLSR
jgi:hypothetical protein